MLPPHLTGLLADSSLSLSIPTSLIRGLFLPCGVAELQPAPELVFGPFLRAILADFVVDLVAVLVSELVLGMIR
jgi:hypothetical protein